jgi:hypothetical protein
VLWFLITCSIPKGAEMEKKWPGIMFSQFTGAEMMCEKYKLNREVSRYSIHISCCLVFASGERLG